MAKKIVGVICPKVLTDNAVHLIIDSLKMVHYPDTLLGDIQFKVQKMLNIKTEEELKNPCKVFNEDEVMEVLLFVFNMMVQHIENGRNETATVRWIYRY